MIKFEKIGNHDLQTPEWNGSYFPLKNKDDINLWPNSLIIGLVYTGFSITFPEKFYGLISLDSFLGRKGIVLMDSPLIIDNSDKNELALTLKNVNGEGRPVFIPKNTTFAKLIFLQRPDDIMVQKKENDFQIYGTIP